MRSGMRKEKKMRISALKGASHFCILIDAMSYWWKQSSNEPNKAHLLLQYLYCNVCFPVFPVLVTFFNARYFNRLRAKLQRWWDPTLTIMLILTQGAIRQCFLFKKNYILLPRNKKIIIPTNGARVQVDFKPQTAMKIFLSGFLQFLVLEGRFLKCWYS